MKSSKNEIIRRGNNPRKVKQIDLNGNLVAVWGKMIDASKETGTNCGSICNCCRGKIKTANGFKWQYDNSDLVLKTDPLDALLDFI